MNKNLIAALVGIALAGVAQAQTNVTLYGIADGGLRWDRTDVGTLSSVAGGGAAGSRWGIRGSEDLGGGMKANFVFEQGIDISNNTVPQGDTGRTTPSSQLSSTGGRLFSRMATVGVSGNFGNLRFGRDYTPHYIAWAAADPFGTGMVGTINNIAVGNITRIDNGIYYDSPSNLLAGFKGSLAVRLGESTTDNGAAVPTASSLVTVPCTVGGVATTCRVTNVDANGVPAVTTIPAAADAGGNALSLAAGYTNGPVYAAYGYNYVRNSADTGRVQSHVVAGTFDTGFSSLKLHGLFWYTEDDTPATATFVPAESQAWAIGVSMPFAGFNLVANYGRLDDKSSNNFDARFLGIGGTYAFSRRTDLYASAARMSNRNGAQYLISDASNAGLLTSANVPGGYSPTSVQVGLRHRF